MDDLISSLHRLPNLAILVIIVAVIASLAMAAPHIGRRILRIAPDEKRAEAVMDAFKAVMAMTSVVLAFALVEANNNLHAIDGVVAKEASALATADRSLLRSGNPQLIVLRPLLAAYGKSIIEDEWPILNDEDRSDATDEAYNALSRQARAVSPIDARQQSMFAELLKSLDDLADLREQRVAESSSELPSFFWVTALSLLGIAFLLALLTTDTLATTVGLGATAGAVALLLAFLAIVDHPFEGETSVQPKEIAKALVLNSRRN